MHVCKLGFNQQTVSWLDSVASSGHERCVCVCVCSGGEDPCAAAQSGSGRGQGGVGGGVSGPGVPRHHHIYGTQGVHILTALLSLCTLPVSSLQETFKHHDSYDSVRASLQ